MTYRLLTASLVVASLALVLTGILLGTVASDSIPSNPDSYSCGSPWAPSAQAMPGSSSTIPACVAAVSGRSVPAGVLLAVGILGLMGVGLVYMVVAKLGAAPAAGVDAKQPTPPERHAERG